MQLPENTPPTTPVVDAGDPFYSPERPPRNVTPVVDVDDPFLSPEGTSRNGTSGGDLSGEFISLSATKVFWLTISCYVIFSSCVAYRRTLCTA